ncbi:MAG: SDR family NAD(P)-dependent oxidoreductase, partial [Desulfatiglandales bacterium]
MFNLENKVAIVTGGGRGLGAKLSLGLSLLGAHIFIATKDIDSSLFKTIEEIKSLNNFAQFFEVDVSNKEQTLAMAEEAYNKFGRIDILVNNVGLFTFEPFLDTKEEEWDRLIALNLKSTMLCSRAVLKEMVKRSYGKI